MKNLTYRNATPTDAYALAELSIMGGDGLYEFLLSDFAPRDMLAGLMSRTMKESASHCYVAVDGSMVVAMVDAFPAALLRETDRDILPQDRVQILEPIDQAQDWESFLINTIAVRAPYRRQGIATRLLDWAIAQGKDFPRVSANVWADNEPAVHLFEKARFSAISQIAVSTHPDLPHNGITLVMKRDATLT